MLSLVQHVAREPSLRLELNSPERSREALVLFNTVRSDDT